MLPASPLPALVRVSLLPPGVQAPFLRSRSSAAPLRRCQGSPLDYSPSPCELFHLWLAVWGEPTLFGLSGDASETQSCARGRWGLCGRAGSSISCAGGYQCSFGWAKASGTAHLSLSWKGDVGFMAVWTGLRTSSCLLSACFPWEAEPLLVLGQERAAAEHPSLPAAGPWFACPVPPMYENIGRFHGLETAAQGKAAAVTEEERDPERVRAWGRGAVPVQRSGARRGACSEPREGKVPSRCEQGGIEPLLAAFQAGR